MEIASLSIRRASREYGLSRDVISQAIRAEQIPARRLGRRVVFLRVDLETWIRGNSVRPSAHAETVVGARLEHEGVIASRVAERIRREAAVHGSAP